MTPEELAAIRERAEQATPGPWHTWDRGIGHEVHRAGTCVSHLPERWCPPVNDGHRETFSEADAVFIARSREDVPALLDHVDALTDQYLKRTAELHEKVDLIRETVVARSDRLSARLAAVRALIADFEADDIMPVGQVTLLRAALDGTPPDEPHVPYLDAD